MEIVRRLGGAQAGRYRFYLEFGGGIIAVPLTFDAMVANKFEVAMAWEIDLKTNSEVRRWRCGRAAPGRRIWTPCMVAAYYLRMECQLIAGEAAQNMLGALMKDLPTRAPLHGLLLPASNESRGWQ